MLSKFPNNIYVSQVYVKYNKLNVIMLSEYRISIMLSEYRISIMLSEYRISIMLSKTRIKLYIFIEIKSTTISYI